MEPTKARNWNRLVEGKQSTRDRNFIYEKEKLGSTTERQGVFQRKKWNLVPEEEIGISFHFFNFISKCLPRPIHSVCV